MSIVAVVFLSLLVAIPAMVCFMSLAGCLAAFLDRGFSTQERPGAIALFLLFALLSGWMTYLAVGVSLRSHPSASTPRPPYLLESP